MKIQGVYYQDRDTWERIIKPVQEVCAQVLDASAGDLIRTWSEQTRELDGVTQEVERSKAKMSLLDRLLSEKFATKVLAGLWNHPRRPSMERQKVGPDETSLHDLANSLIGALAAHYDEDINKKPIYLSDTARKYLPEMARRLATVTNADDAGQLINVAWRTFDGLRHELDCIAIRNVHGIKVSPDWLARTFPAIGHEQNECLKMLRSWRNHPALASLVVGRELDDKIGDCQLTRVLRKWHLPARWLMNWDMHYVHIQEELARLSGSPLSAEMVAALRPPSTKRRGKSFSFTEESLGKHLKLIEQLREPPVVSGAPVYPILEGIGVVEDDAQVEIESPPQLDESNDDGAAAAFEDTDSPGKEEGISMEFGSGEEPDMEPRGEDIDKGKAFQLIAVEPLLGGYADSIRVGVILKIVKKMPNIVERKAMLEEFEKQFVDEHVFTTLGCEPSIEKLTDKLLAANTRNAAGELGIDPRAYVRQRDQVVLEFMNRAESYIDRRGRRKD